jgi:hypothetical protein
MAGQNGESDLSDQSLDKGNFWGNIRFQFRRNGEVQGSGVETLAGIARALRARGVRTPAGHSEWQVLQVSRLLAG